jgi:hypothetical protein
MKDSERYLQMQKKVNELQIKADEHVKGEPALYDANYYRNFKKQREPSLEELAMTVHAIKSMPHISTIRAQIGPVRKVVSQYIPSYA